MPKKKQSKELSPDELQATDRSTILFYKGRHNAFPKSYFYIVKDTNKEVAFKKRLQPRHRIGLGYPVQITNEGRSYGTSRAPEMAEIEVWPNKIEVARWIRDDEAAGRETKRIAEEAGLRTKARKLAAQIHDEYRRANSISKMDIIASFIEALEE